MNVLILNCALRKRNTFAALKQFICYLEEKGDISCELINLNECKIEPCLGCVVCFDKGEEFCPHHDRVKYIVSRVDLSDGVIFATPVYAFNITALMKTLFDRISYIIHRPLFFGKISSSIVTQGVYGGKSVRKYLSFVSKTLGFTAVDGVVLQTLEPYTEKQKLHNNRVLVKLADSFYKRLKEKRFTVPSMFAIMMFRIGRTKIKKELNESFRDYTYYREMGWFESDYYYPVNIGVAKILFGKCIDCLTGYFSKQKAI